MLTTHTIPVHDPVARHPPAEPALQAIARAKKAEQARLMPKEWTIEPAYLRRFAPDTEAYKIMSESGILSEYELELTESLEGSTLGGRILAGEVSASDVVRASCKRAAIAHQLTNCLTEILFDSALSHARVLDEHLARTGQLVGPLHGWPISLKDQFNIEGVDTTMGFVSLVGQPAQHASTLVEILERLGAVIIAKTNVPQTLMAEESNNYVFGRTLNPHNRSLISGGSSGGEGALVALKGSLVGVGTDFGGSIRKPSVYCGLYGLRPTTGRLPYRDVSNVMKGFEGIKSTIGPIARDVRTIEAFMQAVIGAEPWLSDVTVIEKAWTCPSRSERLKIAVVYDDQVVHNHPPVQRALEETVAALRHSGHTVIEWTPFDHVHVQRLFGELAAADGGADLQSFVAKSREPIVPEAFPFNSSSAKNVYELSQLVQKRDAFRQEVRRRWAQSDVDDGRRVDAILCPAAPHLAMPPAGKPRAAELISWTTIWSLADLPVCAIPVGTFDPIKDTARGLPGPAYNTSDQAHWDSYSPSMFSRAPIGLQLVSPRQHTEAELLGMVAAVDRARAAFEL
ncbi:uncharacterized protein JCM15063_000044 [Sporobolomyces koalae]|uniref:uncharacterized protein n=1 Tax=Sporobolomyces koalae TaxID=500713 RepID=UPI00316EF9A7